MIRRLTTANTQRALSEALLLAAALLLFVAGTVQLSGGLDNRNLIPQGFLLSSTLVALLAALRWHIRGGNWQKQVLYEVGFSLMLTAGFAILAVSLLALLSQAPLATSSMLEDARHHIVTIVALLITAPLYLSFRVAARILLWWDGLRRRHLIWSLTHAHLIIAMAAAILLMLFMLLITIPGWNSLPVPEDATPLGRLLDWLVLSFFPVASIMFVITIAGLIMIIPPSGIFSYFVARRTTTRLKSLAGAAARFREGDYTARSPIEGEDEVAQLQADFNTMADNLEKSIAALQAERDTVAGLLDSRRELIANVSHDLRTPAATIRSTLESSLERYDDLPPELSQDMSTMLAEIERQQKLIDDLFLLSRAEVGQLTLRLSPVDAADVVKQVVSAAAPLAWKSQRVEVTADLPPNLPTVQADADRLAQVLHNLVHNAVRYTAPGGIVAVSGSVEASCMQLMVCDTGSGIPADDLPMIWERFYKVDGASGGAGLGLSIVKELVELMNGSVEVQSTVGKGSCFSVRLPRA